MKKYIVILLASCFAWIGQSQASIVVVNGLSHEHNLQTSGKIQGTIVVRNTGEKSKRARIYKTDVTHNCKGETIFSDVTDRDRCNANWMTVSDNEILMQPGQTVNLTYGLNPTEDIEKSGSYWGVIMIEEIEDLDTTKPSVGVKVNALVRYAIQIIGNYDDGAVKDLQFSDINLDTSNNEQRVKIGIQNGGNFMMKPIIILELYSEDGTQVGRKEMPYQKVYPGYCKVFEVPLDGIPAGTYDAILVADCGDENIYGMKVQIPVLDLSKSQ